MVKLFVGVLGLGVAGFDPLGFVALMAAVTLGVKKRAVAVLLTTTLAVTAGVGLALSFGFGAVVPRLAGFVRVPHPSRLVWGLIFGGVGILLLAWGVWRLRSPAKPAKRPGVTVATTSTAAMASTGLLVGLSALIDPAFYAMALLVSPIPQLPLRLALVIAWTLTSHIALVVTSAAVLGGALAPLQSLLKRLRGRFGPSARSASSILLLLLGTGGVVAGIVEFTTSP